MPKIKHATLENIATAARNTYPNEFIALLGGKKSNGVIDELVVLPATYGKNFASLRIDLIPFDSSIVGSVHSHPSPNAMPSSADLRVFRKTGNIHLIIAYPFSLDTVRAWSAGGKEQDMEVVE